MKILTLGDSWTYGEESSDPTTKSWPAQMASKYGVEVVNLAQRGSSNQRAVRIGIEELCESNSYDWVILPLGPASRTEVLSHGKWQQVWPNLSQGHLDQLFASIWHPWNDLQITMHLSLQLLSFVKLIGPRLLITGLSLAPNQYSEQLSWIVNYKNDCDFESLGMPLTELNIGIKDLDRKLKKLKNIHNTILSHQPEYLYDVFENYFLTEEVNRIYGIPRAGRGRHPNDNGYHALADYFAKKIGLC